MAIKEIEFDKSGAITGSGLIMQAVLEALRRGYSVNISCDADGWINAELNVPEDNAPVLFGNGEPILKGEPCPTPEQPCDHRFQWTPVSQELPDNTRDVLVWCEIEYAFNVIAVGWYDRSNDAWHLKNSTGLTEAFAWGDLPPAPSLDRTSR